MSYKDDAARKQEWRKWVRSHRSELADIGLPEALFESEQTWWYFLEHGDNPECGWTPDFLDEDQVSKLISFLEREYPNDEAWCCLGVLRQQRQGYRPRSNILSFEVAGRGWTRFDLCVSGRRTSWWASYLSDAILCLIESCTHILEGKEPTRTFFAEEPGGYVLELVPHTHVETHVSLHSLREWPTSGKVQRQKLLLETNCRTRTLVGSVVAAAQSVLSELGENQYQRKWGHEFPHIQLSKLKSALSKPSPL